MQRRPLLFATAGVVLLLSLGAAAWWTLSRRALPLPLQDNWDAVVVTLAGSGVAGVRDGRAYDAQFADPFGVAAAPDGTMFVADGAGSDRIRRIHPSGHVETYAGSSRGFADGPVAQARFHTPSAIALAEDGSLYVADTGNDAVRRISRDGIVSTPAGPPAGLKGPVGIAVHHSGRLVIADTYNDRIVEVDSGGRLVTIAGGARPGFQDGPATEALFHTPTGVAVARDGTVYVADAGNGAVRIIAPDRSVSSLPLTYSNRTPRPVALALSNAGVLFVVDDNGRVVEIAQGGTQRTLAGSSPGFADGAGGGALFRSPSGIAVAGEGRLIVADRRNALIRLVASASRLPLRAPPPPIEPGFDAETFGRHPLLWPFAPIEGPYEITGTLGEPRGGVGTERLHAGLDLHAPEGTDVRAIRESTVQDVLATSDFESINETMRVGPVAYVHLRAGRDRYNVPFADGRFVSTVDARGKATGVRVKRGATFKAGDALGTVNRFYHAHLNIGWPGEEVNPLAFRWPGYQDTIPPVVSAIRVLDESGRPFTTRVRGRLAISGRVRILVDAWDHVDGNQARRRLGLYRLGYQLVQTDGRPASGFDAPRETLRFDRHVADPVAPGLVYATGSGIPVYGNRGTRFLYLVTSTYRDGVASDGVLDMTALAGDYVIRITATDIAGNQAFHREIGVTVLPPG